MNSQFRIASTQAVLIIYVGAAMMFGPCGVGASQADNHLNPAYSARGAWTNGLPPDGPDSAYSRPGGPLRQAQGMNDAMRARGLSPGGPSGLSIRPLPRPFFTNNCVTSSIVTATIIPGGAAYMAGMVDNTNFDTATWVPVATNWTVNLGSTEGLHDVWFGFKDKDKTSTFWTRLHVTLDRAPPTLVITDPPPGLTTLPMIQLQGYCAKPLASLTFEVNGATDPWSSHEGLVTNQYYDPALGRFTTNYFQCFDISLTNGVNIIALHATDRAGNSSTTNLNFTLVPDTNAPALTLVWPQSGAQISEDVFTLDGWLSNPTAKISATLVDSEGGKRAYPGVVERNGRFWVEHVSLGPGTNNVTLTASDAWGNSTTTNLHLSRSTVRISIDPIADEQQLFQPTINLSGKVSDVTYTVWVNGVKAVTDISGKWRATNVPVNKGNTATFDVSAYPPGEGPGPSH